MDAMTMRMPFTFIVEADGPIRAADLVMESQHMEVVNVEPLLRRRSSVQRVRGGVPLWQVTAIDPEPVSETLYDVIEVQQDDPENIRVIAERKTLENAEAIVKMAVMRRGVEEFYFTTRPSVAP